MLHSWIYEVEGVENGREKEYLIDAKDGKLLRDSRDLL
ncbi:MAG: PepSY domain-containing protein [Bdellovibrionales bacterium]